MNLRFFHFVAFLFFAASLFLLSLPFFDISLNFAKTSSLGFLAFVFFSGFLPRSFAAGLIAFGSCFSVFSSLGGSFGLISSFGFCSSLKDSNILFISFSLCSVFLLSASITLILSSLGLNGVCLICCCGIIFGGVLGVGTSNS